MRAERGAFYAFVSTYDSDRASTQCNPKHFERKVWHQVILGENEQRHAANDAVAIRFHVDGTLTALRRRDFRQAPKKLRMSEKERARIAARFEYHRDAGVRPSRGQLRHYLQLPTRSGLCA